MTLLHIIDTLTGYKEKENFDTLESFEFEIQHSIFINNSLKKLLDTVKTKQIKYIKIPQYSVLNKDLNGEMKKSSSTSTARHYFDYLMSNMIYDIINNSKHMAKWYIKKYMLAISDVIDNFEKYPCDADDFNRMNYGIFINDSKKYGGNCQIFSMIFELINTCKTLNKFFEFVSLCSDNRFKKYYVHLFNNFDKILQRHSQKLNLIFWIVALDIMMMLNKKCGDDYVINNLLLKLGFIIDNKITIHENLRQEVSRTTNCVIYICEKYCHVGFIKDTLIFDIDNMNFPAGKSEFIKRACEYYNFKNDVNEHYYSAVVCENLF